MPRPFAKTLVLLPLLLTGLAVLGGAPAAAEPPAVVRASIVGADGPRTSGTAFFLPVPGGSGLVAVAAAHSLDPGLLTGAREVEFRLGRSRETVARATRLLAPPGVPLSAPGGTVRGDFLVFALESPPTKVRSLEADPLLPSARRRVQIAGVPSQVPSDEDHLFGTVVSASDEKIEIELDAAADLRGWGGAPVLDHGSKKVIGILQAAWPKDGTFYVAASPIEAVTDALAQPLDGGSGRSFASFAGDSAARSVAAHRTPIGVARSVPDPSPASDSDPRASRETAAGSVAAVGPETSVAAPLRPPGESLVGGGGAADTELKLSVERPTDGEVVGDPNGAFVTGRALATGGDMKHFDVMLVIDTSGSTFEPTGADVNGNGVVGTATFGGIFGIGSTDPGDSILAAEVAAAFKLLEGLDPRSTRVGLVSFAGEPQDGGLFAGQPPPAAITEEPLTTDYDRIRRALGAVLQRGPAGATHMAAGADQATVELKGLRGALSQPDPRSEKIVLFLTDGQPTLPAGPGFDSVNVGAVLKAAERARRMGVRFHAFAIGPEALAGPVAAVELAARTGGYFTPVRRPGDIVQVVEQVRFSNVESVSLRNLSTGETTKHAILNADGSFGALVPLQAGLNRIEVTALADDGSKATQVVQVSYAPGTAAAVIPRELVPLRNRLLERKLVELRRERTEVELRAVDQTRKELAVEMERERAKAQEAADRQRKELELDVERNNDP
jgi:hypothetical protein